MAWCISQFRKREAKKIPEAEAAVHKEWGKLNGQFQRWDVQKARSNRQATSKTKKDTEQYSQSKGLVSDGSGKVLGHNLKAAWYGWRNK